MYTINVVSVLFLSLFVGPLPDECQPVSTVTSGFWDDPAIWKGGVVPDVTSGIIEIAPGHTVVVRDLHVADELVVAGTLLVGSPGRLVVYDGPGVDLLVTGFMEVAGVLEGGDRSAIISAQEHLLFNKGSVYRSLHTGIEGVIPVANWHKGSTLEIAGYTTVRSATAAGNWGQLFGNVVWYAPDQVVVFDLQGMLRHIQGSLEIRSTGDQYLLLGPGSSTDSQAVDGDLIVSGTASVELVHSASARFTVSIGRDLILDTSGGLSFATDGYGALVVGRDVRISRGSLTETGSATGQFLFTGSGLHHFDRGPGGEAGVFSGRINYDIAAGDTLDLASTVLPLGAGSSNANTFHLAGMLIVGSTDRLGAIQANTTGGNIRTTVVNRSFAPGSRIVYRADAPQFMGDAGSAFAKGTTTCIDNPYGVTITANTRVSGDLLLRRGPLLISPSVTLTLAGGVSAQAGFLKGTETSGLVISDAAPSALSIPLDVTSAILGDLTLERGVASSETALPVTLTIAKSLNLVSGILRNTHGIRLTHGATVTRWTDGMLQGKPFDVVSGARYSVCYRSNSVAAGPFARIATGIEIDGADASLDMLRIQMNQRSDTVALTRPVVVHSRLRLDRGVFHAGNQKILFKGTLWSDDTGDFGYGTSSVEFADSVRVGGSTNSKFYDLKILPGAKVYFDRNATVFHDIEFQLGSFAGMEDRVVTLGGEGIQSISAHGAVVGGMIIAKPSGSVELKSPLNLRGVLRFNAPSEGIAVYSNGFLNLISETDSADALGNGMIYRLQNGNTVSGNVTVQRFMRGEGRIYRYLSAPVREATVASWKDDFAITGDYADPSPGATVCGVRVLSKTPSLFFYDAQTSAYVAYPPLRRAAAESVLDAGRGYAAFIRECVLPACVDVTGVINQQQVNLPVTFTAGGPEAGWNLVGNPYPCTIDWDLTADGWRKVNISPVIAIPDNGNGGGFFRYWDGDGTPAGIVDGRIATGQAFWVRATGVNPVLAVREGVKVAQGAEFYREKAQSPASLVLRLDHAAGTDYAYVKIKAGAHAGLDSLDGPKLNNPRFDLATVSRDSVAMAIQALGELLREDSLEISLGDCEPGSYRLTVDAHGDFSNYTLAVKDRLLNQVIPVVGLDGYSFALPDVGAPQTMRGRFVLIWSHLEPVEEPEKPVEEPEKPVEEPEKPVDEPDDVVSVSPETAQLKWIAYPNPTGDVLWIAGGIDGIEMIQVVNPSGGATVIRATTNPAESQKMSIFDTSNLSPGFYLVRFYGKSGVKGVLSILKE